MTGTAAVVSRDKGQDSTFNKQARDRGQTNYTYDVLGQLKTAMGKESGGPSRLHEQFKYGYDYARNLSFRTNNALVQSFTNNNLNQLSTVGRSGTLTVAGTTTTNATSVTVNSLSATRYADATFAKDGFSLADGNNTFTAIAQDAVGRSDTNAVTINLPASPSYSYDSNGNLLADGRRTFTYDDENQLNSIIVTNAGGSSTLTTNIYDGLFRRRIRKEFSWVNGTWAQAGEVRYVYDGRLVVQERDGSNVPLVSYTRGTDLSGSREGAGGIGGLLARTDNGQLNTGNGQPHAFYHADGNGNVTALVNDKQLIVARYTYDPFGNILSKSGPLADANTYRFSSKEHHQTSGLVYYLYRFYDPNLQRFVNRDPIQEIGGINLYRFVGNDPVDGIDLFGLYWHHLLPRAVFDPATLQALGLGHINIHDAKWGWEIPDLADHQGIHPGKNSAPNDWNKAWQDWVDKKLAKGKPVTEAELNAKKRQMINRFGLDKTGKQAKTKWKSKCKLKRGTGRGAALALLLALASNAANAADAESLYGLLGEYIDKTDAGDQAQLDACAGAIGDEVSRITGNDIIAERMAYELAH